MSDYSKSLFISIATLGQENSLVIGGGWTVKRRGDSYMLYRYNRFLTVYRTISETYEAVAGGGK